MLEKSHIHIDFPTESPRTIVFDIVGWVATDETLVSLTVGRWSLDLERRPDVEKAHPTKKTVYGFSGQISLYDIRQGSIAFELNCQGYVVSLEKVFDVDSNQILKLSKQEKLDKFKAISSADGDQCIKQSFKLHCSDKTFAKRNTIAGLLSCAECGDDIEVNEDSYQCQSGHPVKFTGKAFDFLNADLINQHNIKNNADVASRRHDPLALALIGEYADGIILDCGSGLPKQNYKNVVNFEIENFDNTDVIGVGESLPFKDNSFDVVFSFSVLEHVKDPFTAAREIRRVLKHDGILYVNAPFLVPLHGYPHHYYNMTQQGLLNLFPDMHHLSTAVPSSGHPLYAVQSMLGIWSSSLSDQDANNLLDLSVRDLLNNTNQIISDSMCQSLPQAAQKLISCTNSVVARKPNSQAI